MTIAQPRLEDLSVYYWLQDLMPDFVTVEDGFPQGEFEPPTVSVEQGETEGIPYQLGGLERDQRLWRIDVFGKNKSQRDDFAYKIYQEAEYNIPVYDYNEGFPPDTTPTQIGVLKCYDRKSRPIYTFKELVRELYWRRSITFWTLFENMEES